LLDFFLLQSLTGGNGNEGRKNCRNAVFHVQPQYQTRKLLDFITTEDNVDKVHRIHKGIGDWLRDEMLHCGLAVPSDFA